MKINFDGSCGAGSASVVVRDCVGKCILVAGKKVETSSIYETELMGAWLVVSVVHHQCYSQKLVFEGDSLMSSNDINKEGDNLSLIHI